MSDSRPKNCRDEKGSIGGQLFEAFALFVFVGFLMMAIAPSRAAGVALLVVIMLIWIISLWAKGPVNWLLAEDDYCDEDEIQPLWQHEQSGSN